MRPVLPFLILAFATRSLAAQDACTATTSLAAMGIDLECTHCTLHAGTAQLSARNLRIVTNPYAGARGRGVTRQASNGPVTWIEFGSEPTVAGTASGSPAASALQRGDAIVAVEGELVTTAAGGRRLSSPPSEGPTRFTIRRRGREMDVTVEAVAGCDSTRFGGGMGMARGGRGFGAGRGFGMDSMGNTTSHLNQKMGGMGGRMGAGMRGMQYDTLYRRNGRGYVFDTVVTQGRGFAGRGGRGVMSDSAPMHVGRGFGTGRGFSGSMDSMGMGPMGRRGNPANAGWLGFGLECNDCSVRRQPDGRRLWSFSSVPTIAMVETDSPADHAGIREGDILVAIDGQRIVSGPGATRFSMLRPGQRVRLEIQRGGRTITVTLIAVAHT